MQPISTHTSLACRLALAFFVACAGSEATITDDPARMSSAGLDSPSGALDGSVRCTYFYRQSNELMVGQALEDPALQFEERVLNVAAGQDASQTLGRLTFSVGLRDSEQDVDTVSVSAAEGANSLFSILYQLPSGLPQNQFAGGHGFTGLLYFKHPTAGGDYQAYCESVR